MAKRSVRNKLRWQVEKAIEYQQRCLEHLATLDAICDERSDYVKEQLPNIVSAVSGVKELLQIFRRNL